MFRWLSSKCNCFGGFQQPDSGKKSFQWQARPYCSPKFTSEQSSRYAAEYKLRPSDVVVLTFPKTGTTMLQQVCEVLRTNGDMNFSEITEVQPWLDNAWDCGQELDADHRAAPRVFKSHQLLSAINPGAKYVTIVRDPEKTFNSYFSFMLEKGMPDFLKYADLNEYAKAGHFEGNNIGGSNVWAYYLELWEALTLPNVLVLSYEEMVRNPRPQIRRIANFIGIKYDEDLLNLTERMSSMEFMKKCESQFDDNFISRKQKEFGRSKFVVAASSKVNKSLKPVVSAETKQWLQQMWAEKIEPATGLKNYAEMESFIANMR